MTELLESSSLVGLFTVIIRRILIGSEFITQVSVEIKQENNLLIISETFVSVSLSVMKERQQKMLLLLTKIGL